MDLNRVTEEQKKKIIAYAVRREKSENEKLCNLCTSARHKVSVTEGFYH